MPYLEGVAFILVTIGLIFAAPTDEASRLRAMLVQRKGRHRDVFSSRRRR